jgi:hypothetical protein
MSDGFWACDSPKMNLFQSAEILKVWPRFFCQTLIYLLAQSGCFYFGISCVWELFVKIYDLLSCASLVFMLSLERIYIG